MWAFHRLYKNKNKNQTTEGGGKKQTNTDSELQNVGRWNWHFLAFYVCSCLLWELWENLTQLPKMLTHHICSRANWPALYPGPEILTLYSGVSLLTDHSFALLFRSHGFSWHSVFVYLCARIDKGIPKHSGATSKILKMIPLATQNTQRPTNTSIYIYEDH